VDVEKPAVRILKYTIHNIVKIASRYRRVVSGKKLGTEEVHSSQVNDNKVISPGNRTHQMVRKKLNPTMIAKMPDAPKMLNCIE